MDLEVCRRMEYKIPCWIESSFVNLFSFRAILRCQFFFGPRKSLAELEPTESLLVPTQNLLVHLRNLALSGDESEVRYLLDVL